MSTDPVPPGMVGRIAKLSDEQAVQVLALVLEQHGQVLDPLTWRNTEPRLRQAVSQPELRAEFADATALPTGDGELARYTLRYIAESQPPLRPIIDHAMDLPADQTTERFDPATLAVGGLVLLALQTEIELKRDESGRWRFRFHKKALRDSTLGTLIGKLVTTYGS